MAEALKRNVPLLLPTVRFKDDGDAVTVAGSPETVNSTPPLNADTTAKLTVTLPVPPGASEIVLGAQRHTDIRCRIRIARARGRLIRRRNHNLY